MNEISSDRRPKQRGKNLKFALHRYIARKEGEKERKKSGVISVNLSGFQQIQVQEKWIKNRPNQRGEIRNLSFEYREREGKNWREIQAKRGEIWKFEGFPANPSKILPTFCHGNKVKPLKIWKKLTEIIVGLTDLKGRPKENQNQLRNSLAVSRLTNKRTNKTKKWPRGSKQLAERSLSSEFHANQSVNKEMAADLVGCVQVNKQTNKQN